jgi:membrane protease YdiL (CAAX protease family)
MNSKKSKYADLIKNTTDKDLLASLYLTQLLLIIISLLFGVFLFEGLDDFTKIFIWNDPNIFLLGGAAGLGIVFLDLILMKVIPNHYYDDGGLNERIFRNRSFSQIVFIAAIISISEEIFFRGVIQTHFGIVISSIIFALVHYRYLFNWFLFLNVTLLSFVIGYIYLLTENLLVTIFMHFIIDFLLGCYIRFRKKEQEGILDEQGRSL